MPRRRSVPGAQESFLDAVTRVCPTCQGEGTVPRPVQVRATFTLDEARALMNHQGHALDDALAALRLAVDRGVARQRDGATQTCATCGGTRKVTILPR